MQHLYDDLMIIAQVAQAFSVWSPKLGRFDLPQVRCWWWWPVPATGLALDDALALANSAWPVPARCRSAGRRSCRRLQVGGAGERRAVLELVNRVHGCSSTLDTLDAQRTRSSSTWASCRRPLTGEGVSRKPGGTPGSPHAKYDHRPHSAHLLEEVAATADSSVLYPAPVSMPASNGRYSPARHWPLP